LMVNFLYAVTGLKSFDSEFKKAHRLNWLGLRSVPVLPLQRIYYSKSIIQRPKDIAHMTILKQLMACERKLKKK
jgi:hypothetical protein